MTIITKASILALDDRPTIDVPIPEWSGAVVRLRAMSGEDLEKFVAEDAESEELTKARLISFCAIDENGERMFRTAEEIAQLATKNAAALFRLYVAIQKQNKLRKSDLDDLMGNSVGVRSESIGSSSPNA